MNRGPTGHHRITPTSGEAVRAFVPRPRPPDPPFDLTGRRQTLLEQALLACGLLDGVCALLCDPDPFFYAYVRREAVLCTSTSCRRARNRWRHEAAWRPELRDLTLEEDGTRP